MKVKIIVLLLLAFVLSLASDIKSEKSRKHYGMSFHVRCENYVKSFTCMTACKSIGFQVFRMDQKCKCSCHELKTTTILPFFKWYTNGSTQRWHKTQSVPLYNIVGTLSPPTYMDYSEQDTRAANTTLPSDKTKDAGDSTGTPADGAATKQAEEAEPTAAGGAPAPGDEKEPNKEPEAEGEEPAAAAEAAEGAEATEAAE